LCQSYVDLLPEDHRRERLLRALPEGLRLLGGVDAGDADLVLLVVCVQDGDGVAVRDRDDGAGEGRGVGREGKDDQ